MSEPKYVQIIEVIKQRIKEDIYLPGEMLPNQNDLATELGVSRMTVKKSLDILGKDGYVYSKRGAGTVVRKRMAHKLNSLPIGGYDGLSKELGGPVTSQVIKFAIHFPSLEVQQALELDKNDPVYEIRRLRIVNGQPYGLEHTFLPLKIIPDLNSDIFLGSFYQFLHHDRKLEIGGAQRSLSAEKADGYDQKYLKSYPTDPILQVKQIVYLKDGRPFEISINRHPYAQHHTYTYLDVKHN
ncbi:GntR family transcriptional regulator [Lapidilactobacillus mulanensis]|uniref:GntR family transcriptional regulator n=1 Tax=Lapidilactobacillus mulanensis TaxID=2485999 RepID=A0ABW4DPL2_9LACO|nr:GntR family transcriptional regulator [Lapidilactobacillus mulanensis]